MILRLLLSLALLTYSSVLSAATVGETLPHSLKSVDQTGQTQSFETLKGEKGLILVFVRSTQWCPYCKNQLKALNASKQAITHKGYNLVAISYDPVAGQKAFSDKNSISYPLLSDEGSQIIKAFGILNESIEQGTRAYGIPHPTLYQIDHNGVIRGVLAEEGYKNRPSIEAILGMLEE